MFLKVAALDFSQKTLLEQSESIALFGVDLYHSEDDNI